jgi:signal peptidase I
MEDLKMEKVHALREPENHRTHIAVFRKLRKYFGNVLFAVLLILGIIAGFFAIQSKTSGQSILPGQYRMLIVLSGSMNPAFDARSVIFIRPIASENIVVGDIVTFSTPGSKNLTTHRVVEIEQAFGNMRFITKGDANEVNDPYPVYPENIIGKVHYSIPYLGFIINYAQTRNGLFFMVILPCILIIAYELIKLIRYAIASTNSNKLKPSDFKKEDLKRSADYLKPKVIQAPRQFNVFYPDDEAQLGNRKTPRKFAKDDEREVSETQPDSYQRQFRKMRQFEQHPDAHKMTDALRAIKSEFEAQINMMEEIMERRGEQKQALDYNP